MSVVSTPDVGEPRTGVRGCESCSWSRANSRRGHRTSSVIGFALSYLRGFASSREGACCGVTWWVYTESSPSPPAPLTLRGRGGIGCQLSVCALRAFTFASSRLRVRESTAKRCGALPCGGSGGGGVAKGQGVAVKVEDPAEPGFQHLDGLGIDAVRVFAVGGETGDDFADGGFCFVPAGKVQ